MPETFTRNGHVCIEVASCNHCERQTVAPASDECRHCGRELDPVSLAVPISEIFEVEVNPEWLELHPGHAGFSRQQNLKRCAGSGGRVLA